MELPVWFEVGSLVVLVLILVGDLLLILKRPHIPSTKESTLWVVFYVTLALIFAGMLWLFAGHEFAGQFIAGDRSSRIEQMWLEQGIRTRFRIRELESKSASMAFLKSGRVQAAIMPLEVGIYLAREHQLTVRALAEPRVDTPVAIAVKKGNQALRQQLDGAVRELIASGEIAALYQRWFGVPFEAAASQSPRRGH